MLGFVLQPRMKLSLAYPVAGTQKLIEIDDDAKLCVQHWNPALACTTPGAGVAAAAATAALCHSPSWPVNPQGPHMRRGAQGWV